MPLKTLVKVGSITNLSDARYCSGMGVEMLGFTTTQGRVNYISPGLYQEIRGWVPGPKIVAEIYGLSDLKHLATIIHDYAPDYLEMSLTQYQTLADLPPLPLIVQIAEEEFPDAAETYNGISYWIVDQQNLPSLNQGLTGEILVTVSGSKDLEALTNHPKVKGIAVPDVHEFDRLAEILESLEE